MKIRHLATICAGVMLAGLIACEGEYGDRPPAGTAVANPSGSAGAAAYQPPADAVVGYSRGNIAPDWSLSSADGGTVTLSSLRGNVVVIDFWATWCGPCKRAMPGVQKVHERFRDRPVKVYGLTIKERGDPKGYMASQNFTYGLLLNADQVARAYGVNGIPAFFVIGVDGTILHSEVGFSPSLEQQMASVIDSHLAHHGL